MRKLGLLTILALLAGLVSIGGGVALASADLEVDVNDPNCNNVLGDPFCDIQAAVDAASPGDEIEVNAGTYNENVLVTTADLLLDGEDAILDGTGLGGNGIHVFGTSGVEISGFIVERFDRGILLENVYHSQVSEVETRFNDDAATGILASLAHNGLDLMGSHYNHISEVFAHHNGHNGMTLAGGSSNNTLEENTTNDNGVNPALAAIPAGCGIQLSNGADSNSITENESLRNAFGILLSGAGSTGNVIEENELHQNERVGIEIRAGSSGNFIIENDATGNGLISIAPNFGVDLFDQGALDNTWEDNEGTSNF